jgi:CheY-like chemotaxis protein
LVADNDDSRSIVSELLTAQGARVTQASSAAKAIVELTRDSAQKSRFELVLIAGTMLRQGAFEVAEFVMSGGTGRLPIVMMLGTNDLSNKVARLHTIGIEHYIVKPVRRAELFAAVARSRAGAQFDARGHRFTPAVVPESVPSAILEHPLKILMADDSSDNRALIRAYLKKTPYLLVEAEDGQEAIDKFIAGKFDLVLMDIQMPVVDGFEATSTIRVWEAANGRRRTPIVALTASAMGEAMHRTLEAGCDAHVTKPVKKSTLLEAIRNAIETAAPDDDRADVASLKEEPCRTE